MEDSFIVGKNKLYLTKSGGAQKHGEPWTLKSGGAQAWEPYISLRLCTHCKLNLDLLWLSAADLQIFAVEFSPQISTADLNLRKLIVHSPHSPTVRYIDVKRNAWRWLIVINTHVFIESINNKSAKRCSSIQIDYIIFHRRVLKKNIVTSLYRPSLYTRTTKDARHPYSKWKCRCKCRCRPTHVYRMPCIASII